MTNWQISVSSCATEEEKKSHYAATVTQKIFLVSEYIYMKNHYLHSSLQKKELEKSKNTTNKRFVLQQSI